MLIPRMLAGAALAATVVLGLAACTGTGEPSDSDESAPLEFPDDLSVAEACAAVDPALTEMSDAYIELASSEASEEERAIGGYTIMAEGYAAAALEARNDEVRENLLAHAELSARLGDTTRRVLVEDDTGAAKDMGSLLEQQQALIDETAALCAG